MPSFERQLVLDRSSIGHEYLVHYRLEDVCLRNAAVWLVLDGVRL